MKRRGLVSPPHFKVIDVPLDNDGKLNYFAKYGKEGMLSKWQDAVADQVAHLGIERGTKKSTLEEKIVLTQNNKGEKTVVQEPRSQKPKRLLKVLPAQLDTFLPKLLALNPLAIVTSS